MGRLGGPLRFGEEENVLFMVRTKGLRVNAGTKLRHSNRPEIFTKARGNRGVCGGLPNLNLNCLALKKNMHTTRYRKFQKKKYQEPCN